MKNMKKLVTTIMFGVITLVCHSQNTQSIDAAGGYESNGYFGRVSYGRFFGEKNMVRIAAQYHFESYEAGPINEDIDVNLLLVNLEYYYQLLDVNGRDFVILIGAGGFGGHENITENNLSNGAQILEESDTVFGGHVGIEFEKYLARLNSYGSSISLIANARQNYFLESQLGDSQFNASIGFRFNF